MAPASPRGWSIVTRGENERKDGGWQYAAVGVWGRRFIWGNRPGPTGRRSAERAGRIQLLTQSQPLMVNFFHRLLNEDAEIGRYHLILFPRQSSLNDIFSVFRATLERQQVSRFTGDFEAPGMPHHHIRLTGRPTYTDSQSQRSVGIKSPSGDQRASATFLT